MTKPLTLIFCIALFSCDFPTPTPATKEEKTNAMRESAFDPTIIDSIDNYNDLKYFIFSNFDTLITYRNSKSYIIEVESANNVDTILQAQSCYSFFSDDFDKYIPMRLRQRFDKIYSKVAGKIEWFEICNDRKVTVVLKHENKKGGLTMTHSILWNGKIEKDYAYTNNKDTLLRKNCIYRIGMTEYHGH